MTWLNVLRQKIGTLQRKSLKSFKTRPQRRMKPLLSVRKRSLMKKLILQWRILKHLLRMTQKKMI